MHEKHLHFLREKIYDLQSALFFSKCDAILKIPTSIVTILKVDDLAQLWFFIPKPKQSIYQFDKEFYSELRFYRKGKDFYLKIDGRAYILNDPEELNGLPDFSDDVKKKALCDFVLVKVKILNVGYFECRRTQTYPWMVWVKDQAYKFIFNQRPGYKPFYLQTDSMAN